MWERDEFIVTFPHHNADDIICCRRSLLPIHPDYYNKVNAHVSYMLTRTCVRKYVYAYARVKVFIFDLTVPNGEIRQQKIRYYVPGCLVITWVLGISGY